MARKVYDCFTFWKELDVLEIRLNELYEVVDKFVIIESSTTHTGISKPFYLRQNLKRFDRFKHKIYLVSDSHFDPKLSPTRRQNKQRELISTALEALNPQKQDLIILSDCDEIPRKSVIKQLIQNPANSIFELDGYLAYYNLYFQKWKRGRAILYKDFKGAQKVHRDYFIQDGYKMKRHKIIPFLRINPFFSTGKLDRLIGAWVGFKGPSPLNIIKNAGWHFSKMFSDDTILESVKASSHTEFNSENISIDFIQKRKNEYSNFYGGSSKGIKVAIDDSFPEYLRLNAHKFKEFLLD